MKMTKQFKTLLQEYGEQTIFGNRYDQATRSLLTNYFYKRYACDDDDDFIRMFQYNLDLNQHQFEQYLRIQNTDFDPMVGRYLEKRYKDVYNRKDEGSSTDTSNNTNKYETDNTGSHTGTLTDNRVIGTDETRTDNLTETNQGTNSFNDKKTDVLSDMPQANVGSYTGQDVDNINLTYATRMTVGKDAHTGNDSNTQHNTGTVSTETDTTDTNTQTQNLANTSNTTFEGTNNTTKTNENTNKTNYDLDHKEVYTGREEAPQDMLERAKSYIITTNAYKWLIKQLDVCFMYPSYGEEY